MRRLRINLIGCVCLLLMASRSAGSAFYQGASVGQAPDRFTAVILGLGMLVVIFLSVPRNFGNAMLSEVKHRVGHWIGHE